MVDKAFLVDMTDLQEAVGALMAGILTSGIGLSGGGLIPGAPILPILSRES
jgi:hypothetical protein